MKAVLLNRIILLLSFAGLFVAGVLSMGHLLNLSVPCGVNSGCEVVANHPASRLGGIPVAYFGFLTYVALCAIGVIRTVKGVGNSEKLVLIGYGLTAIGTVFSLYLQYQSFFVIRAQCPWCITSAAIMVLLLIGHAVLAQMVERGVEAKSSSFDSIFVIALPIVFALALGMQTFSMNQKTAKVAADQVSILNQKITPQILEAMVAGNRNSIGPENAKLTIIEFADLQCGACQTRSPMVKEFAQQFPDKIRFVFRHFPLTNKHEWAMPSAAVAEYAAEKGKFWDLTLAVMGVNRELESADELYGLAEQVGLDVKDIEKRLGDPEDPAYKRVQADSKIANDIGVLFTPTFILVSDGKVMDIANSGDILEKLQSDKYKKLYLGG